MLVQRYDAEVYGVRSSQLANKHDRRALGLKRDMNG